MTKNFFISICICFCAFSCKQDTPSPTIETVEKVSLFAKVDGDEIKIYIEGQDKAIVTQNAQENHRPYLHPITAPNSTAELTQYSPGHHKHQTGLYWGFTRVNGSGASEEVLKKWFYDRDKPENIQKQIGRDFFHNVGEGYWKKQSANILTAEGNEIKWQTKYHMLDAAGEPILLETQQWTLKHEDDKHLLSLEWKGEALQEFTVNEFSYGGMFLRMPWHKDIKGKAENAARQTNQRAEGQRAMWVNVGMEIEGLEDWGHIAIFDHPDNDGFPTPWRVDGQLGIGPTRAIQGDWSIPKGDAVVFRHQVVAFTGELSDIQLNELWGNYVGDKGMYNTASLWGIAQKEGRDAKLLSPEEAVAEMTIKEGYEVNAFASEPMITQPMAFCWDHKGRMWIAENRDYESRGHGFSKYGDSKILILEDTDHDGVADKKTVFLEDIPFPSGIAVGFDGLYLGAPPNLLFVPDKNKDDKADVEDIEVLLTGWGIRDRHETINSLHWGPDGWLYGLEGFATPSVIRKPNGKGRIYRAGEEFPADLLDADGVDINGGVWRYHPTKDKFEAVAHGFSNPWGIDYDSKGQLFISACVIPHLFHIIPGGIYHRQGGRHFNPYVYKDIQTIVDHRHRSAHGGARIYQSDAFPAEEQGKIFMANIHEHNVLSDILNKNGSGFTASHGDEFMEANNAQWIGFSMEVGPEGGLYVLDWHDADICGKEVLNKETGRVFRIMPEKSLATEWDGRYEDLESFSDLALAKLQTSKSNWHAQHARTILQSRAQSNATAQDAITELQSMLNNGSDEDLRLRALWSLHVTNNMTEDDFINLLSDKQEYVRAWAIQLMTEDQDASQEAIQKLKSISAKENSPVVRLYLANALQRISNNDKWGLLENLVSYDDADDPNIPFMLWFGLEPLVAENPEKAIALAAKSSIPMVTEHIARRLVDADQLNVIADAVKLKSSSQLSLIKGLLSGVQNRNDLKEPTNWNAIVSSISEESDAGKLIAQISQNFGSTATAEKMIATIKNNSASLEEKRIAINMLGTQQRPELLPEVTTLLKNKDLRIDAIRAASNFENKEIGEALLAGYNSYNPLEKKEAIQTLSSRPAYGWILAGAIRDKKIAKKEIPPYIALQLRRVVGNGFVEIWGPIDDISSNKKAEYAKYRRLLQEDAIVSADPVHGKEVFYNSCWSCHKMYGDGGIIGPDLTGSNRGNVNYLLGNVIEPSAELQDDYKLVIVTTQDGRTYSGNVIAETDRQLTMRIVGQDELILNKSDIQSRELTEKSMMPEGLFENLNEQDILNLMAFMRTIEPVGDSGEPSDD